jgi:pimeloyl-ACP methyl ester carboxylesterase
MLHVERSGEGAPVVLLHGLTATHRYVVMGSKSLQRAGHDVVAYDARGHGASDPAPSPSAYAYEDLAQDLLSVLDEAGFERAVLAGASMGAHTAVRLAMDHPERVAGLVVITPAYDPESWPGDLERWDALSAGLRNGGVDGFVEAYGEPDPPAPEKWRATLQTVLRQRLSAHEHPDAVADALQAVPRSRPFAARDDLRAIAAPTVVVADRDAPDPGHPLAVGELYASLIPGARLVVEEEGQSPIAWQGGQLSKVIASVAAEAGLSAA